MTGGALKSASMDDFDLRMSDKVRPLYEAVKAFIRDEVDPITEEFYRLGATRTDRLSWAPGQLELLDGVKAKAKAQGLGNFFLPNAETGEGLSNLDYAYIANELGKNRLASECLNCSAPDTGNMEVIERYGNEEQKEQWLKPLLAGLPGTTFYEVPVIGGMARMGKWFIDSGMRRGTPKALHENVITVWGEAKQWKARAGVTDDQLAEVSQLTKLRVLHLPQAHVSDRAIEHLEKLTALESLVLGNTSLGDNSLDSSYCTEWAILFAFLASGHQPDRNLTTV